MANNKDKALQALLKPSTKTPTVLTVCACPYCKSADFKKATKRQTGGEIFVGVFEANEGMQVDNDGVSQFNCNACKAVFYAEAKQTIS